MQPVVASLTKRPYRAPKLVVYGALVDVTSSVGKLTKTADGHPGVGMSKTK